VASHAGAERTFGKVFPEVVVFTVIVPTHERPYLLHRALSSLVAQTFTDFQVIIVSVS
jgi:hypothetical protein